MPLICDYNSLTPTPGRKTKEPNLEEKFFDRSNIPPVLTFFRALFLNMKGLTPQDFPVLHNVPPTSFFPPHART